MIAVVDNWQSDPIHSFNSHGIGDAASSNNQPKSYTNIHSYIHTLKAQIVVDDVEERQEVVDDCDERKPCFEKTAFVVLDHLSSSWEWT